MLALRPERADALLAIVLSAFGVALTLTPEGADDTVLDTVVVVAVAIPVAWRSRAPLAAALAFAAGVLVSGVPTFDQPRCGAAIPAALLILFSVGRREPLGRAVAGLVAVLGGLVVLLFTDPLLDAGAAFVLVLATGVWGAARVVRSRSEVAAELATRSEELERTREDSQRLAVEADRADIAADLDASTRGTVERIVGLAQSAGDDPRASQEVFGEIERSGRASLEEMRDLLGDLRGGERPIAPQPGLDRLPELVDATRARGVDVTVTATGHRRALPQGVELAAYRLIQHALEALATEHDPVEIALEYGDAALGVEVHGADTAGPAADAALAAARARATTTGGTFDALPDGEGRRVIRSRLPLVAVHG